MPEGNLDETTTQLHPIRSKQDSDPVAPHRRACPFAQTPPRLIPL